jgi:adenylosuccinate lyase
MLDKMRWVADGMVVDAERMSTNLDASYGLVHSQSVLGALLSKSALQREDAYLLVQRNAMLAWEKGRPLIELLKSDPDVTEHLDPDEIDECFNLGRYLGHIDTVFERLEML